MTSSDFHPALGSPLAIPTEVRALFDSDGFCCKGEPVDGDWLAQHVEGGQPLHAFIRSNPNRPDEQRHVIYLQPFGQWGSSLCPSLEALNRYARAYFLRPVEVLPPVSLGSLGVTERYNHQEGRRQLLTTDILRHLARTLPEDAYCLLGISMEDLYPDPNWNFVFGQASLRNRVGVYSFARYTEEDDEWLMLRRSLKVMAHEIGHMYGLTHCTYFECGLNGSNHLEEADRRPMHLCPVCLRKLQWSSQFDVLERYFHLDEFYRSFGFERAANFVRSRIERCAN